MCATLIRQGTGDTGYDGNIVVTEIEVLSRALYLNIIMMVSLK